MTLHTINLDSNSPTIQTCFDQLSGQDALIFLDKGVINCQESSQHAEAIKGLSKNKDVSFYCLDNKYPSENPIKEVEQFGIISSVKKINYAEFVALTIKHDKTVSWF